MTPCTGMRPKIALLVGGELPAAERPPVEEHLASCATCRSLAAALREDRRVLAGLAEEELSEESLHRTRRRVMEAITAEGALESRGRLRWILPLAATLALLTVAAGLWLSGPSVPDRPDRTVVSETAPTTAPQGQPPAGPPVASAPEPSGDAPPRPAAQRSQHPTPPPGREPAPAPEARERLAVADPVDAAPGPAGAGPLGAASESPSVTIRIVSDDPDVVYYWLTDEPKESTDDEAV